MKKIFSMLLVLLVATFAFACSGCQNQVANVVGARSSADDWVKNTLPGYELVGFNSATLDQDGDGYVSADITVRKIGTTTPLKLLKLQCPTQGQFLQIQKGQGAKFDSMPFNPNFD